MPKRTAQAQWKGKLKSGEGMMKLGSGAFEGRYSFGSRFEDAAGTNPEELIAAAHAGCFSMALSLMLEQAGHDPSQIQTTAEVSLKQTDGGFAISDILLITEGTVPGIDQQTFLQKAENAKANCPVSKALAGTNIRLEARLKE